MEKIAIIIENAFSYAGTENICNFMTESIGKVSRVDVISLHGKGKPFYKYGNAHSFVTLENVTFKLLRLRRMLMHYDHVFVISMGKLSFIFRWFVLFNNKVNYKTYACEHVSIMSFPAVKKLLKYNSLKKFSKVIVLTDFDKRAMINKGINAYKICNPISYKNNKKTKLTKKVIAVGRLEKQKNFSELIDIWEGFLVTNSDYRLYILGDGSLKEELENKIINKGLSESIFLLGKVDNIDFYYKNSDFLVMTSIYEGLPLALLEAKAWSLPVIAYDCPTGPKEIINDGIDGYLIEQSDRAKFIKKMEDISLDSNLLMTISNNTEKTHLRFDINIIEKQWQTITK